MARHHSPRVDPGFALSLVTHRNAAGLSQPTLAGILGVDEDTIRNWERGRTEPKASQIQALALALGIEPGALFHV